MKEKRYLVLIFLTCFSITAQIKGYVVDDENQPIPYVNIWVENENIGTTSEDNGSFSIYVEDQNKVLVLSALGFDIKKVKVSEAEKVVLKRIIFQLDEVVISKSRSTVEVKIGNSKNINSSHLSGTKPWIFAKRFNYINDFSKTPFIKNIIIFTKNEIKNSTFKVRIFGVDKEGGPGLDLLKEDIIVKVKKGKRENIIDLTNYNLLMLKNGIFIAFESMIIESNKFEFEYKERNSKKTKAQVSYAPNIMCNVVELENTFEYNGGKWIQRKKSDSENIYKNKVIEPAINLTLTN